MSNPTQEPKYAFIDEGTSAVSQDVEGLLYETCKNRGITLITISTRAQLKKYHTFQLQLDGPNGGWEFDRIGTERERSSVENELRDLREKVKNVEVLRERLKVVEGELARVFVTDGELAGYDDALAREIEARMQAVMGAGGSSDGAGGFGVVVGSAGSAGEHTVEEVTSEEAGTGEGRSESVERMSDGEDNDREAGADLELESFADFRKPVEEP